MAGLARVKPQGNISHVYIHPRDIRTYIYIPTYIHIPLHTLFCIHQATLYVSVHFNLILPRHLFEAAYFSRSWGHSQPCQWAVCSNIQVH